MDNEEEFGHEFVNEFGNEFEYNLDFDYNENDNENDFFENFLHDSEEFTSFISSGYGTRPNSTLGFGDSLDNVSISDPSNVISSLHLDIPELEPILQNNNNSPRRAKSRVGSRAKMTDLGFKMSKVIMSSTKKTVESDDDELILAESGDSLVDNYGQGKKRQKTGKRGRPKGTVKVGTQFGRASSTHALPPNVSALMGQANVAYVQKQYAKAIELYLQVVQRAPSSPEPYYSLGLVYEEEGDPDRASSYFLIAAHLQPRADGELWRRIAALLVQVPKKEQAIYCLTRAIKAPKPAEYRVEDDFPIFWLRAKLQLEFGQYKSVITGFGTALRGHFSQDPEDLSLFVLVARLAVRMSLAYVAAGVFKNVFRSTVAAALPLTWSHLNVLIELAEVDEDFVAIMEAIEEFAVPCYLQSGREQGRTDWILKSPQEQFQVAVTSAEMPVELKLKMTVAQVHLGRNVDGSEEILKFLAQIDRPGIKLKLAVADALSLCNSHLSAVQILLECIENDGSLATSEMCLKIGQNYRKAGELTMAVESFLAVLQVDPEHRATRLALSETYRSLGQIEEALQVLPAASSSVNESAEDVDPDTKEKEFINWQGLDDLFVKVIGIGVDFESLEHKQTIHSSESPDSSETDEIYSESATSSRLKTIRFGPERQKRTSRYKNRNPQISASQSDSLRSNYESLMRNNDKKAGGVLLQFFSDNLESFRNRTARGLEEEEWSRALLKILILQAADFIKMKVGRGEWERLTRVLKNILTTNLMRGEPIKWRVLGLILSKDESFFIENLKSLLNTNCIGAALLPSVFLHRSSDFLAAFYHPITFRFLTRLNRRSMQGNPALFLLLGHQSLETQNYDEAARMYLRAGELCPEWTFVRMCVGNALLGRAFQRTCSNQLAKLMQALGYFMKYVRETEMTGSNVNITQSWFNMARALHQSGFSSQAVGFYRKCIVSDQNDVACLAKYNLSRLYLQNGSIEMARLILKR